MNAIADNIKNAILDNLWARRPGDQRADRSGGTPPARA